MAIKTVQVIINSQTFDLEYNSDTGNYEKTITPPQKSSYNLSGHYYPVILKATNEAGTQTVVTDSDSKFGEKLRLKVKEITPPVSIITSPTEGERLQNTQPTVNWSVTDNDSGVNPETISITIDTKEKVTEKITKSPTKGGYNCSYAVPSPLEEGNHLIKVDATDFDGNQAVQRLVNIVVDTVPPQLSVESPANNLITNKAEVTVSGTTKDVTSNPCTLTVQLNSEEPKSVSVDAESGKFSTTVTLNEGVNTITVVSTDQIGKQSTVIRTVTFNKSAPVIQSVEFSKNPVNVNETFTITVKATD